jgi:hypothetical protein
MSRWAGRFQIDPDEPPSPGGQRALRVPDIRIICRNGGDAPNGQRADLRGSGDIPNLTLERRSPHPIQTRKSHPATGWLFL